MAFVSQVFTSADGTLSYTIIDEAKAAELQIQKDLISAIKELTRVLDSRR